MTRLSIPRPSRLGCSRTSLRSVLVIVYFVANPISSRTRGFIKDGNDGDGKLYGVLQFFTTPLHNSETLLRPNCFSFLLSRHPTHIDYALVNDLVFCKLTLSYSKVRVVFLRLLQFVFSYESEQL